VSIERAGGGGGSLLNENPGRGSSGGKGGVTCEKELKGEMKLPKDFKDND